MTGELPQVHPLGDPTEGIALRTLGCFDLLVDGALVELPVQAQKVIAFLALHEGSQPRERVAMRVWPDTDLRHCMGSLRTVLWRVRRDGLDVVHTHRGWLALGPSVQVDLQEGWEVVKRVLDGRPEDPEYAVPLLSRRLLPDWDDEWVLLERERIQQMYVHCLETLSRRLAAEERYAYAMQAAKAACRIEPLRESARGAVIDVHLAEGNRAEARRVYEDFRRLLQAEMGIEPSARLMSSFAARALPIDPATPRGGAALQLAPDRVRALRAGLAPGHRFSPRWSRQQPSAV